MSSTVVWDGRNGSLHQGDLSGLETEEGGLEERHHICLLHQQVVEALEAGSPSSESFISSELSDSGFYSVSAGEFRHFQRLLEKRMRLYNARMQHQGESWRDERDVTACPKSHRELLEAIPETLTMQPQCQHMQMEDGTGPMLDHPSHGLFKVSSVQFHKSEQPCLNRHSSSSGALFNPSQSHTPVPRITGPILSTCSTPSSHRRPLVPIQQLQSQSSASMGILRRSRTLHHRPPAQEYRRRASHPASPSYCAATLHHCGATVPPGVPRRRELMVGMMGSQPGLATSPHQHSSTLEHIIGTQSDERCYNNSSNANGQHVHHDWWHSQERIQMPERDRDLKREIEQERQKEQELERELEIQEERHQELEQRRARERQHFESLCHPPQPDDVNDTWPKPASRQAQGGGGGGGLYSTLEGHTCPGSVTGWDSKKEHMDGSSNISPSLQQKPNPNSKPSTSSRISRSQFLRDRASQLADERSGMSTDEETNTDMLMGRYWSRTERKEHFMLAREQRQQHQAKAGTPRDLVTRAVASAGGGVISVGDRSPDTRRGGAFADGRCNTVLELSQRKLSRLRNRKLLDDWTTVEELLTHGNRLNSQEDTLCPSSLLTVTTV
ncbi:uncharacterized protein LOC117505862 [Thalassophryne amazonica]|uniref:uncharacterized protein LOC117505862 n=1 Tax=Thalassophryne amazonica TaxID=390379 RepID=UPI0014720FF4|nr:uncharacterized protein LOC117505862 [Thalassophryne amazonica]